MGCQVVVKACLAVFFLWSLSSQALEPNASEGTTPSGSPVASVYISQDFLNEQLATHSKSKMIKDLKIELDPNHSQFFLRGMIQVPVEEMRAINLDPKLGAFRFQLSVRPSASGQGHLVLDFPLSETFFYPATSRDPKSDRVIVPVQMLSLALASARGYLAALSGDFSGFDRRTQKLKALLQAVRRSIREEKNADALEELKTQQESLKLQLAAVPIERKQLQTVSKEVEHILSFTGEKELNLNDELGAKKNALILKIRISQLAPFLKGVDLGGVRVVHDKKDGHGENFMAIDINSQLALPPPPPLTKTPEPRPGLKSPPALILRLKQSLFESSALVDMEQKKIGSRLKNLSMTLKDDGLHVAGEWKALIFTIPFDTIVDFVSTGLDVFEVRVRRLDVEGIDLEFLSNFVLEALKARLDHALKGICTFKDIGEEKDHSRALQVTVEPKTLVPAFPDLHLVDVDVREQEFLLKVGRP